MIKVKLLLLIFLIHSLIIYAQIDTGYAKYLFETKDYFRAISAYKELLYHSDNLENNKFYLSRIVKAYYFSDKFKLSINYNTRLAESLGKADKYYTFTNILYGLNYYKLKNFGTSEIYFDHAIEFDKSGFAAFYKDLLNIESGDYSQAAEEFKKIADVYKNSKLGKLSNDLSEKVILGENLPSKSPFLASILSAIVPGSGQVYSHHYYDGLQSFMYVAVTSFAAFASYRYDKNFNNNFITTYFATTIAALFYTANIIGAYQTAKYYNYKQKVDFNNNIIDLMFSIELTI